MTKCFKCGGTEMVKGKITRSSEEYLWGMVFAPEGLLFLTLTPRHGTKLQPESNACLGCGAVWSQTDANALRGFIRKHCKPQAKSKG